MKWLLIETSGKTGQVALAMDDQILASTQLDQQQKHARDLAPATKHLFEKLQWQPKEVDAVAVSLGPGSYTGLRVGLISAKVFAFSTKCRLIGIPTFELLAWQGRALAADWQVIEDAQKSRFYHQQFHIPPARLGPQAMTPMQVIDQAALLRMTAMDGQSAWLTGPAMHFIHDELPSQQRIAPAALWHPQMPALLELALMRHAAGQFASPESLEPLYYRPSSAEEQWKTMGR